MASNCKSSWALLPPVPMKLSQVMIPSSSSNHLAGYVERVRSLETENARLQAELNKLNKATDNTNQISRKLTKGERRRKRRAERLEKGEGNVAVKKKPEDKATKEWRKKKMEELNRLIRGDEEKNLVQRRKENRQKRLDVQKTMWRKTLMDRQKHLLREWTAKERKKKAEEEEQRKKKVAEEEQRKKKAEEEGRIYNDKITLHIGVPSVVCISAHVSVGHFFVQVPTHPSFSLLALLNQHMFSAYTDPVGVPELAKPYKAGVLCAAPSYNSWFRALTLAYDQVQDRMWVRFVDYGGFAQLPRANLRQLRTDFMRLPMQAIECYLANVQPADGSSHWSEKANELFQQQLNTSKTIQASLVGYFKDTAIPCVELFMLDNNDTTVRIDQILLERGLAKPMAPTLMVRRTPLKS